MSKLKIKNLDTNEFEELPLIQGEKGERGYSAYEIAVKNGYKGTEAEWTNAFLSPDGYYGKTEIDSKENNLKAENEYLNSVIEQAFTPVEKEGTSINYDNTINARFKDIKLCGDTTQNGTPTPDTPVPVNVVTGEQKITISSGESKQEYPLSLGSMELCKIGTYQDYLYKDNGKWYKHSEIGKVVLNGSENWGSFHVEPSGLGRAIGNGSNVFYQDNQATLLSNKLIGVKFLESWNNTFECIATMSSNKFIAYLKDVSNLTEFTTKLASGYEVYYALATPTNTEITDTTLLEQLEELAGATTYAGETNIVATSDGLTIIPKTTALTK